MLTEAEFSRLIAGANQGVMLLMLTVALGFAVVFGFARLTGVRVLPGVPEPFWRWPGRTFAVISVHGRALPFRIAPLQLIVLVGALVRLVSLFTPVWYDETFTARIASLPFPNLYGAVMGDVHPPLFYGLEWLAVHLLGNNLFALRLFPAFFGVAGIVVAFRLAKAYGLSTDAAHWSALTVAVLPSLLYYSVEARGYSLLVLLVGVALLSLEADHYLGFVGSLALIPLTHNLGYVFVAVIGLIALIRYRRRVIKPLIVAAILPTVWLPFMMQQSRDVADGFWLGTVESVNAGLLSRTFFDMLMTTKLAQAAVLPAYVLGLALTLLCAVRLWRWLAAKWTLPVVMLGVPLLVLLASVVWHNVFLARAMLGCTLALALVWAKLTEQSRFGRLLLALTLGVGLIGFLAHKDEAPDLTATFAPCRGRTVWTTDIPAATFAGFYLQGQPVDLWTGAGDLNQQLPDSARSAMQFRQYERVSLTGPACVIAFDTPLTKPEERAQWAAVRAAGSRLTVNPINETWHVLIYEVP